MKNLKRNIKRLLVPGNKLLVFNFHQSTPSFDPAKNDKYIWSDLSFFESQLNFLRNNFEILKLDAAINQLRTGQMNGTKVAITFDDGDISVQEYIIPLLTKLKIPASFFINSAYFTTDKKGYWFNIFNYLISNQEKFEKYLSVEILDIAGKLRNTADPEFYENNHKKIEDISKIIDNDISFYASKDLWKNLDAELFSIGLHGHEHQRFSMMPKSWQKSDLLSNIEILSKFNTYKPIFAIPFGKPHDWNNDTIEICKELELEIAFANGGYNVKQDHGILRIPVDGLDISKVLGSLHPFINRYYK